MFQGHFFDICLRLFFKQMLFGYPWFNVKSDRYLLFEYLCWYLQTNQFFTEWASYCLRLRNPKFLWSIIAALSIIFLFSSYFFALLMHPAYAEQKISLNSWRTNPVPQVEITGSNTLYMVWARQGILNVVLHLNAVSKLTTYAAPKISYAAVS